MSSKLPGKINSLVTREVAVSDVGLPKWARKVLEERGLKEAETLLIRKGITPEDTKFKESERSSVDYITTKSVDRDGEIVVPNGANLDHYRKNPVVLFVHDYKSIPIGKSLWIKKDENGLISKTQYAKHQKANDIYEYRKDGFPMAKSIGFIPLKTVEEADFDQLDLKALDLTKDDLKGASKVYPEWLMLEYSDVPVPANPDALQLAMSKGIITAEELEIAAEEKAFVMEIIEPDDSKPIVHEPVIELIGEIEAETDLSSPLQPIRFKSVEGIAERWNTSLSKEFDVEGFEAEPSAVIYKIASEWLECEIKDMFVHDVNIPSVNMGNYLSGLKDSLKGFELVTARNFMSDGSESPLRYEVIQLTSEKSGDFLVGGMEFYKSEDSRVIIRRRAGYFGLSVTAYSDSKDRLKSMKVFSDTRKWVKENNLLKGECFGLSGKFIEKTDEGWDSLFLDGINEKAVRRSADLISEKGKDLANRGLILMGPPGTGKTLSGRIIRNTTNATFIWVSARDLIYSGAVGGISYGFRLARELSPSVLFIEDIDNWLHGRATDLMKTEMDGLEKTKGIVTVLTSNYPETLPPALIDRPGRFHDVLNFSLPDKKVRTRMLKSWASEIQEKTVDYIVENTSSFSGAHIFELISFAKTIAEEEGISIDEALQKSLEKINIQREMVENLKHNEKELEVLVNTKQETVCEEVEEKAGRVLSKKTRSAIGNALDGMRKAIDALDELMENVDSEQEVESEKQEVEEEKEKDDIIMKLEDEPEVKLFDIDEEVLKGAIADTLGDLLRDRKSIDVGAMVNERLKLAKGEIY